MDLNIFIKRTLLDIRNGINSANDIVRAEEERSIFSINTDNSVEFDVAVTAESKKDNSQEGNIKVWGIGIGGKKIKLESNVVVSRIKFVINSLK